MIPSDVLTRMVWALAIIAVGLLAWWLYNRSLRGRAAQNSRHIPGMRPGTPAVLYFTTPDCAACKTVQRPALRRLQEQLGERLQVIEIDAVEQPDLASRWGVLSVPTTFILDPQGQLKHINHGVARVDKLIQQIQE